MTGTLLFNRQHSSTAGHSDINKIVRRKLRRCSSADDHILIEITSDKNQSKQKLFTKNEPISSDNDSGIEDFDQQIMNYVCSQSKNVDEEEILPVFGACEEEEEDEDSTPTLIEEFEYYEQQDLQHIHNDLTLAAQVRHEEKKDFCLDTSQVFHAEFARLIAFPISFDYPDARYHLLVEDGIPTDPCDWSNFAYVKLDNAKAQFKCPNTQCGRSWTSMRARISFKISCPNPQGFVVLKIYGQNCKFCKAPADAFWYMEEVCRVMENLSKSIFETFFPSKLSNDYFQGAEIIENFNKYFQRSHHDPHQRKGQMRSPHDKIHCEACQRGWCFN